MPTLSSKLGSWDLPHVHMWKDRKAQYSAASRPLIQKGTSIATIGSCFAAELAHGIERLGLDGDMHPTGLFYNTASIRQEIERIFGGWPAYREEPYWHTSQGWVHPFKDAKRVFQSEDALRSWSDGLDQRAEQLFRNADVIVVTLGLIEAWRNPKNGNVYRQITHPDVFEALHAEFFRLSVAEMRDDLEHILGCVQANTRAKLVVTVSPVPLHATLTPNDVRVANTESKSRIRAAVSEFVEAHPEVTYFHSYELVSTAEKQSDFMMEDGRHVHRHAVDYILSEFLRLFGAGGVVAPEVDTSWLTAPEKTAARIAKTPPSLARRVLRRAKREAKHLAEKLPEGVVKDLAHSALKRG